MVAGTAQLQRPTGGGTSSSEPGSARSAYRARRAASAKGRIRQGFYGSDTLGFNVTRAEIAQFTAAQVDDDRYIGAAPAISN